MTKAQRYAQAIARGATEAEARAEAGYTSAAPQRARELAAAALKLREAYRPVKELAAYYARREEELTRSLAEIRTLKRACACAQNLGASDAGVNHD
jgi:hypothetical protein